MKELRAKVTVVVGGMAGSEGKGKVAGYLAIHDDMTHAKIGRASCRERV